MKPSRSLPRQEPRKLSSSAAIIACMVLSLCLLSLVKSRYCTAPKVSLQMPVKVDLKVAEAVRDDDSFDPEDADDDGTRSGGFKKRPMCDVSGKRSDTCDGEGDVRVQGGASPTIFIDNPSIPPQQQREWKIRPYPRKGSIVQSHVKQWLLKASHGTDLFPRCTANHSVPAVVFSVGGFTGNLFHDFTDVLVPLFATSYQFSGEVQFLTTDTKPWWVYKFQPILKRMSRYGVIDADADDGAVHCFPRAIVGPTFHRELGVDKELTPTGYSMAEFRKVLREALGLTRESTTRGARPRLLIIARKQSRAFMNQKGMEEMARSIGYDVALGEPDVSTDLAKFARLVNSADVMIGVHGAGLTNMVFLPRGAVVIQVVPLGGLEWLARDSFRDPAMGMDLNYLEYRIQTEESSLAEEYEKDHPVLKDPLSVHKQGWDALKSVYLDKQNVRPHLGRLKDTLVEAMKLLPQEESSG